MTSYRFSNALAYTHAQLAEMHNISFTGYFFPMTMSAETSAWFWRVYQIDAASCVVMHDEHGAFVGKPMHARFAGRCAVCGQGISEGDAIVYNGELKKAAHGRCGGPE